MSPLKRHSHRLRRPAPNHRLRIFGISLSALANLIRSTAKLFASLVDILASFFTGVREWPPAWSLNSLRVRSILPGLACLLLHQPTN